MSAMGIFLALCAVGAAFMVAFFVALCRESRCHRSGNLISIGEQGALNVNATEPMVDAEWSIHLETNNTISKGACNPGAA